MSKLLVAALGGTPRLKVRLPPPTFNVGLCDRTHLRTHLYSWHAVTSRKLEWCSCQELCRQKDSFAIPSPRQQPSPLSLRCSTASQKQENQTWYVLKFSHRRPEIVGARSS